MSKGNYVCQKAAQEIIAEAGSLHITTEAVETINLFINEFISLLITTSSSLDLIHIKSAVISLLPHSLGKNSLVEAEIELKNQIEEDTSIQDSLEDLCLLEKEKFPMDQIIPQIQQACSMYCNLALEDEMIPSPTVIKVNNIVVPPIVLIYITTIIEHIAEYVLNTLAITLDQADSEHIKVQEVLLTLIDDPQIAKLFSRMSLKEKLEKKDSTSISSVSLPSPASSPVSIKKDQLIQHRSNSGSIHKDDEYEQNDESYNNSRILPSSNCSIKSSESINDRPLSIMSTGTVKSFGSRSRFNFFSSSSSNNSNGTKKDKRNSISLNFGSKKNTSPSIASPITPSINSSSNMDFEDLIRSGGTKKVTLTPNRLRSIEIKEEPIQNNNILKLTRTNTKKQANDTTPPIPPLPQLNREHLTPSNNENKSNSPPLTPVSTISSHPSHSSRHSIAHEEETSLRSCSTPEDVHLSRNASKISTASSSLYSKQSSEEEADETSLVAKKKKQQLLTA